MACELKLGGKNASSIIHGNDSINVDQDFTLPNQGGELITSNTPGGGQIVGYQQGAWIPTLTDGVANTETSYQSKFMRIGPTVFLSGRVLFTSINSSNTVTIESLPYSAPLEIIDGSVYAGSVMCQNQSAYISAGDAANNMSAFLSGSVNKIYIYWASSTPTYRQVQWKDFNSAGDSGIIFNLHYQTPDTTWQPINGATVQ